MPDYISKLNEFLENECPLPNHWCNGQPIKNQATIKLPPCPYYIPGKGCMHPENPKYNKKTGAIRN